jgi:multidrug efflux pump subunit AcrB
VPGPFGGPTRVSARRPPLACTSYSSSRKQFGPTLFSIERALKRPHTFLAMALLILMLGVTSILRTPTDIFPTIGIPVVTVIWTYPGVSAQEMANRITTISERAMTTTVNDIEHIESQSLSGVTVIKVFFHPTAKI